MGKQGFKDLATDPFLYQEITSGASAAIGIDTGDNDKWKMYVLDTGGAAITGSAEVVVDPAANGDVTFMPNGTGNFIVNNGSDDTFKMTNDGEGLLPLQSAFFASNATARLGATGDGTYYDMIFEVELVDQNSDYDHTTGVFTAPKTGNYRFEVQVSLSSGGAWTQGFITLVTSDRTIIGQGKSIGDIGRFGVYIFLMSVIVPMDAADTAYAQIMATGGTQFAAITATQGYSNFGGALIC